MLRGDGIKVHLAPKLLPQPPLDSDSGRNLQNAANDRIAKADLFAKAARALA